MRPDLFARVLAGGMGLHDELSKITAGRAIDCKKCGAHAQPTLEEMAGYFRNGWPVCCGETMMLGPRTSEGGKD